MNQQDYNKIATYGGVLKNPDDILKIAKRIFELNLKRLGQTGNFDQNRDRYMTIAENVITGKGNPDIPEWSNLAQQAVDEYKQSVTPASATKQVGEAIFGKQLGPSEYKDLVTKLKVTDKNFGEYFMRDGSGNIYVNPRGKLVDIDSLPKSVQDMAKKLVEESKQQLGPQIKDPKDLSNYTENQITREPDGKVYLKPGVEPVAGTTVTKDLTDTSVLPDYIKNSDAFKALNQKNQGLVAVQWEGIQAKSLLDKIRIDEALKEAAKLADPIFKQSILLASDTLKRNLADTIAKDKEAKEKLDMDIAALKEDFITKADRLNVAEQEAALKDIEMVTTVKDQAVRESSSREAGVAAELARTQRRIDALSEDLKTGKQDISLEEQATLARQLKEYQRNLQTTQENAVDAGMGFSSIRAQAEQRLSEDLQYVTESTQRQAARQKRLLETSTGRDTTELLANEAEIKRKNQEDRVSIARQIEQKTGFDSIPQVLIGKIKEVDPSFSALGIRGDLTAEQQRRQTELQQQQKDIDTSRKRAEAEAERQRQVLEREREKSVTEQKRKAEEVLGSEKAQKVLPGGPDVLGGITGTLEQKKTEDVQKIGQTLFDTGFTPVASTGVFLDKKPIEKATFAGEKILR